jgi:hypothetical protein
MTINSRMKHRAKSVVEALSRRLETDRIETDRVLAAVGGLNCRLAQLTPPASLREAEFKVFSQWNEDGIIQYLIDRIEMPTRTFVEFGVGDYSESNTRFLASNNNWSGVIIDSGVGHRDFVQRTELDWRFGVRAVTGFVTCENVNNLIGGAGLSGDIGLLSIDVDGMDYWLLDAIEVVSPRILVIEYNAMFGPDISVTVPYQPDFAWDKAHWSWVYFGASLRGLVSKAKEKGYMFVGCESHGVNAFFVRNDVASGLQQVSVEEGFAPSVAPVARTAGGKLDLWKTQEQKLHEIADLPLLEVPEGEETTVGRLLRS